MNTRIYQGLPIMIALLATTSLPAVTMANPVISGQTQVANVTVNNYLELGKQEYTAHNYKNALVAFDQAIKLNPDQAELYYWRARTLVALGEKKLAIADLKLATCKAANEGNIPIYDQAIGEYNTLTD